MSSLYPPIARGATISANGTSGLLPAALIAERTKFYRGDGTFQTIAGGGDMLAANNLSDVVSASASRTNLVLGNVENTALSTWAGTTNITTVGTISAGTWSGTTVAVNKGGSGATTLTGVLVGNGTSAFTAVTAPSGTIVGTSDTQTLTNKRQMARVTTITSNANPTVNTDNCDCVTITAQAVAITSMTTNLSGTPVNFDQLEYRILDNGTIRGITWGSSFVAGPASLPTTTVQSKALHVWFEYDSVQTKWVCLSSGSDA